MYVCINLQHLLQHFIDKMYIMYIYMYSDIYRIF